MAFVLASPSNIADDKTTSVCSPAIGVGTSFVAIWTANRGAEIYKAAS